MDLALDSLKGHWNWLFHALWGPLSGFEDSFGVQNISNLVWANATLGFRADALHADLLKESLSRLEEFTTQELAIASGIFNPFRPLVHLEVRLYSSM